MCSHDGDKPLPETLHWVLCSCGGELAIDLEDKTIFILLQNNGMART